MVCDDGQGKEGRNISTNIAQSNNHEAEIDPQKSIEPLRDAIAVADTGIGACVTAHAAAPPEEH